MDSGINIRTVAANGFSMDYFTFGNGDKTLVILPGLSVDSVMKYAGSVADAYSPLAEQFTVYVFDRRKELPSAYSIYDMARDTAAAFRALSLEDISLFGASQGGMIAMVIAIENPGLVRRLIAGSTASSVGPAAERTISKWISFAKDGNAEDLYLEFGKAIYPQPVFEQSKDPLKEISKSITPEDLERFVILAGSFAGFDITEQIKNISCPVLVIGSHDDNVLGGSSSEKIYDRLKERPDCKLHMYDGYGHAAYDLAPDYKEILLGFLT